MVITFDLEVRQLYRLAAEIGEQAIVAEFTGAMADGGYLFAAKATGFNVHISHDTFESIWRTGGATRLTFTPQLETTGVEGFKW